MNKQQIIDYIMHTPSNTNPAMLGQLLDEFKNEENNSYPIYNITVNSAPRNEQFLYVGTGLYDDQYYYIPLDNGALVQGIELDLTNGCTNQNIQIMAFNTSDSYELMGRLNGPITNIETTGNITCYDGEDGIYFLVTGDCTITLL